MRAAGSLAVIALTMAGCGADGDSLEIFAASSLTDVVAQLDDGAIDPVFASSSSLAAQLVAGAPADVFLSADRDAMQRVVDAGRVTAAPVAFTTNSLVLAVPSGNPAGIRQLADLADTDLTVGLCAPEVPCGALAARLLAGHGIVIEADSLEPNVRSLLTKIALGELDAGLVYRTDVLGASVETVPVPGAAEVVTTYLAAPVSAAPDGPAFIDRLVGPEGQAILAAAGFTAP